MRPQKRYNNQSTNAMSMIGTLFVSPSYENVEWFLYVTDPANLELYVYPKHVDLEACCDRVTITTMTCKFIYLFIAIHVRMLMGP